MIEASRFRWLRVAAVSCMVGLAAPTNVTETSSRTDPVNKITPLLYVEAIEPALGFWTERLGFEVVAEVPEGERLGFVLLRHGTTELMYQTRASMENDMPALAEHPMGGSMLYIEVADLDEIEERLRDVERVVPRRTTFYGAQEIVVREPAGNLVAFAEFARP